MGLSNPFANMTNMGGMMPPTMGMPNYSFQNYNPRQMPQQIDRNKFKQAVSQINQDSLSQLVAQARMQGISDENIQAGLSFINNLRTSQ